MKSIKSSDAKAKFSELLDDVERGETLVITRHGKAIAHLLPVPTDRDEAGRRAMRELRELRKSRGRCRAKKYWPGEMKAVACNAVYS